MQRLVNALLLAGLLLGSGKAFVDKAMAAPARPTASCSAELETWVPLLLRDLPAYTNRVTQRTFEPGRSADRPGHVLIAGAADYTPLPIADSQYTSDVVRQVFFTTLERQYAQNRSVTIQDFHRVFFTPTSTGWDLVLMFSQIKPASDGQPPIPPFDSSQGAIAQAIRLWLRDCQAGAITATR
jgi:hypothetical protein